MRALGGIAGALVFLVGCAAPVYEGPQVRLQGETAAAEGGKRIIVPLEVPRYEPNAEGFFEWIDADGRVRQFTELPEAVLRRKQVIVEAVINGEEQVRLLVDTGAERTVLYKDRGAVQGGFDNAIAGEVGTVTGERVLQKTFFVDKFQVGGVLLRNYRISVLGHREPWALKTDGVLGADFLFLFRMTIDYEAQELILEYR